MQRCHASAVVWREAGILIRGPSGSGKSTLAAALLSEGRKRRVFSRLVADDIVALRAAGGRLLAHPHPRLAGRIERRGIGIVSLAHEPACVVRLAVDLGATPVRMPEPDALRISLLGITIPRLIVAQGAPAVDTVYHVVEFLAAFRAPS